MPSWRYAVGHFRIAHHLDLKMSSFWIPQTRFSLHLFEHQALRSIFLATEPPIGFRALQALTLLFTDYSACTSFNQKYGYLKHCHGDLTVSFISAQELHCEINGEMKYLLSEFRICENLGLEVELSFRVKMVKHILIWMNIFWRDSMDAKLLIIDGRARERYLFFCNFVFHVYLSVAQKQDHRNSNVDQEYAPLHIRASHRFERRPTITLGCSL